MSVPNADPSLAAADEVVGPEVPLCLSCWTPHGPREDFCSACGAPVSTGAVAGAYETIWAWGWALGASGRWAWTRRVAMLVSWAYALEELHYWWWTHRYYAPGNETVIGALVGALWGGCLFLYGSILAFVTRRWWRLKGSADPSALEDIQPDLG